jgi:DNA-binding MarR family transcriptional regulator
MSRPNIVALLRDAYLALNDQVLVRLAESGHGEVRPAHAAVFQYLDDTGTTVSRLAERARMTKQAMAELVAHLEKHGYVIRRPSPDDRRAKAVLPTERGREVKAIAQAMVPEVEGQVADLLGPRRAAALRADLERLLAVR